MPSCSVINCKNHSKIINVTNSGVSYHRFPQDPIMKEKWIDATARRNWMPSETSTICSEHFNEDDILISRRGHRYMDPRAVPVKKILIFHDPDENAMNKPVPSARESREIMPTSFLDVTINENYNDDNTELESEESYSIPKKKKLERMLNYNQCKIKKQLLYIKRLQTKNRRLKSKIKKSDELLKSVQHKFNITDEELTTLKKTNFIITI